MPINEIYVGVAVGAVTLGAFLHTWVGYQKEKKTNPQANYDINQFFSSFIIACLAAFATLQYNEIADRIESSGYILTAIFYVGGGFLLDKLLSKLDNGSGAADELKSGHDGEVARQNSLQMLDMQIQFVQDTIDNKEQELEWYQENNSVDAKYKDWVIPRLQQQLDKAKQLLASKVQWKERVMTDYGWNN